ncbi:MAG TPA: hypothetical protein PLG54_01505 [Bacteroidales bacterium]|nr:hypothetical protein [Bacteroidales bacterium]HNU21801.1 hypothetical protein [Bacteroidales bacterium]HNV16503.1 hypothetical protein [Bacteroidales bacterium]HNZ78594.1 hypothetical protein [Bacteroidales bacterium]HOC14780.1 hypothetical protein [Bacteroidales bacterium]
MDTSQIGMYQAQAMQTGLHPTAIFGTARGEEVAKLDTCVFWERMVAKVRHTQSPTGHGGQHGSRKLAYTVCH